jgi:serine/threonine protein kinase
MASSSGAFLVEGSKLGRYTITRLVGEGGMGAVYEAQHRELGKRVAIKTLHQHHAASTDVRARFVREGQAASRIRHPHVVDVYDVAVEGDMPYLVMEFLEGEDVAKLVAREGALSVQRAVDLLLPAVSAVAMANELGVVHRDLKPENVFLCVERGVIRPRVVDFGISKLLDKETTSALTATDAFLGTPFYMSPEQAQGAKNVDAKSDQYSLGVILYECVTGRRPFDDPTLYKLMHKIVTGDFPKPRSIAPELPPAFEAVILKAMAIDPAGRFESTRALGAALLPFASDRTRAVLWEDFAGSAQTFVDDVRATPKSGVEPAVADTLGQSAHQLDTRRRPPTRRTLALLVGGLAVGGAAWFLTRSPAPARISAAPAIPPPVSVAAAPVTPAVVTPIPAAVTPSAAASSSAAAVDKGVQSVPTGAADLSPKAGKGGGAKSATERAGKAVTPGIPKLAPR